MAVGGSFPAECCLHTINELLLRLEGRNVLTLLKLAEVSLLGRHASTYCYNRPSHVYLELTARCNLRCRWCVQVHEEFRHEYAEDMPFETFQAIVPKLRGTKVLYLCLNGEPLLYDRIFDAVALAKQYVPSVRFVTNGTLLTPAVGRELKKAGLSQLGVSIDSPNPEMMLKIRGVSLEKIAENVQGFCRETNIPVEVRSTICDENAESLKALPRFVGRFPTCRLLYFTLAEGGAEVAASGLTMLRDQERFEALRRAVVQQCRAMGIGTNLGYVKFYPDGFFGRRRRGICDSLFGRHLAINARGCIMPCCRYWGEHLESVVELPFPDAWNGPLTRRWRKRMLVGDYTRDCSNWCGFPSPPGTACVESPREKQ